MKYYSILHGHVCVMNRLTLLTTEGFFFPLVIMDVWAIHNNVLLTYVCFHDKCALGNFRLFCNRSYRNMITRMILIIMLQDKIG